MDFVTSADIGSVSLDRMVREGVLVPLSPGFAAPPDLPVTPGDRARSLSPVVPSHTVVSGLAGLWVHRGGSRPRVLTLVGPRGLHRTPPGSDPGGWVLRFHSGAAAFEAPAIRGPVQVAQTARCIVDSLRWEDLDVAIPEACHALEEGAASRGEIESLVYGESLRGAGVSRLRSVWAALEDLGFGSTPIVRGGVSPR